MDYKKRTVCFKPDKQIQALVYKIVPHLYAKENQRMEDFYRSTTVRASSSCSDDSVIERERNQVVTNEEGDTVSLSHSFLFSLTGVVDTSWGHFLVWCCCSVF